MALREHRPTATATQVTLLAASTLTTMAPTIVAPALPSIGRAFTDAPNAELLVPLVLTLPALVIAVSAPLAGVVVDRVGRRPVLLTGVVLYGVAGGTGLVARTLPELLLGRAALGLAVAAVLTAVTTVITDLYEPARRRTVLARQAAAMGASGTVFTIISGLLAGWSWRWSFLLYPAALILLPLIHRAVPEPARLAAAARHPAAGVVSGPGTVAEVADHPAPPGAPARGAEPPWRLVVAVAIVLLMLVQVVFYLLPVHLPFVMEDGYGLTPRVTGWIVAIPPLAFAGASLGAARVAGGRRRGRVIALAFGVTGVGYLAVGLAPAGTAGIALVAPGLVVGGAGLGLAVPNLVSWVAQGAPTRWRGRLLGVMTSVLFLGQFLSPLVWQSAVSAVGRQPTYALAAISVLVLAALALVADRGKRRRGRVPGAGPDR